MTSPESPTAHDGGLRPRHTRYSAVLEFMESFEHLIYIAVGVVFLVAAIAMLIHSVTDFVNLIQRDDVPNAVVTTVNDLLLVIIIMEVLRTVLSYLKTPRISLRPFLIVAAISATRQILSIGAHMSVAGEAITPERFTQLMTDMIVNAGVILLIAFALFLTSRLDHTNSHEPHLVARHGDDTDTRQPSAPDTRQPSAPDTIGDHQHP